jgi:hypothetical protein
LVVGAAGVVSLKKHTQRCKGRKDCGAKVFSLIDGIWRKYAAADCVGQGDFDNGWAGRMS